MRLGLMLGYSGRRLRIPVDLVLEADRLGWDSVWTAESWGSDAVTPLAYLAAKTEKIKLGTGIMQLPARSPAMTAMTAITMDHLSNGRFICGLGTSGPQVVEGWHGRPFFKTLTWMREYITIVRNIFDREGPLTFDGVHYQLPFRGENSSGQGKPLKSMIHGRSDIPIYTGSMAPKSQAMSAEIADGCLLTCMHPERNDVLMDNFQVGLDKAGKTMDNFDVASTCVVAIGDDLDKLRAPLKQQLALYIGGMGSRKKNFYNNYIRKVGFEAEAIEIQDLYLDGKPREATAKVTDEMVDALYMVGSKEKVRDRFQVWKESCASTLMVGALDVDTMRFLSELAAE
jgi:F420-dependent oxidoreductase-like protein